MANLIEQMNVLKGLTDENLQAELAQPSGSTPPFLVASEANRRKEMRQRYEAETARRAPSSTVLDDLKGGMGAAPQPAQMGPSGIEAAMPMEQMPQMGAPQPEVPGFAHGGIVDYDGIAARYNDKLEGLGGDKDRARAMALLAAGAGMMGGGPNFMRNVGAGISAGTTSYQDALKTIDSQELDLLRGITDVGQAHGQDELARMDADFRERQLTSQEARDATRLAHEKKPADVLKYEYLKGLPPEERADAEKFFLDNNRNVDPNTRLIAQGMDDIYQDVLKAVPSFKMMDPAASGPAVENAKLEAYARIKAAYGLAYAEQWADGMGIPLGDRVLAGAAETTSAAGGGEVHDYTTYFPN